MTNWLVTHDLGSDDESVEELTDDDLVDTIRVMVQEADALPDGYAMLVRKADYLVLPEHITKSGFKRGHLTLIQGGKT